MSQVLYRKWRPQTWEEVVGQDHVIQTLRNAVRAEHVSHAYLFAGPRGTGKTTTARLLAKAVNCQEESPADRPCNQCAHCMAINDVRFLDMIEIDAASNTSVEDVRELREKIYFAPNEGRYKVYIIDEVHMLSTAAFNALLKTLEEPPAHALFVLATTEVHKIPATVLSRCQRHEFRRIPVSETVATLTQIADAEHIEIESGVLELIARQSTGSMRDAISLLDQLASSGKEVTLQLAWTLLGTSAIESIQGIVKALIAEDIQQGLALIHQALDRGADPRQYSRELVDYLRELLLIKTGNLEIVERTEDLRVQMQKQASEIALACLTEAIRNFSKAALESKAFWQSSLPLELAFVETSVLSCGAASNEPLQPASKPEQVTAPGSQSNPNYPQRQEAQSSEGRVAESTGSEDQGFKGVMDHWSEILGSIYEHDPRTQALLNSSKPLGLEKGSLVIAFRSDLLREKMEKGHNLTLVKQALQTVLGYNLEIRCILLDRWQGSVESTTDSTPPIADGGMVETALRDLGAQVVDVEQMPSEGQHRSMSN